MSPEARRPAIPLWPKLALSAFVAVLVPFYLSTYGPTNFVYFCDIALLLTTVALWTESARLASACAVGIVLPQLLWMADFLGTATGFPITGMTGYMFDAGIPLFARFLSFFHFWLPVLIVWLVARTGYDGRGLPLWWGIGWAAMAVSYFFLPMPPAPPDQPGLPVNVNYVFGFNDVAPQTWMPAPWWFGLMLVVLPAMMWWPSHRFFLRFMPQAGHAPR